MGQVYRATDVRLGRDVAIKLLSSADRHDRDLVERFLQEARITAALDRPNIVRLFDVGIHDDRPFLVMEFLEGETLRERLGHGPLQPDEIRRVALDVAHGLTAAHAAGLVHRDLKPENLFLTRSGPTKILDFGVAKLVQGSPVSGNQAATVAGMLVGTAGYLAPEQILGETVDARADLFAFGAILYEMLTGRAAFGREHTIDTLHAVLREPVPSLREEPGVASDMAAIADRLLEKVPGARFHSAADLAWALELTGAGPSTRRHWPRPIGRRSDGECRSRSRPQPSFWPRCGCAPGHRRVERDRRVGHNRRRSVHLASARRDGAGLGACRLPGRPSHRVRRRDGFAQ